MKNLKRLFYYLLINVLVSACTTIVVLNVWNNNFAPPIAQETEPVSQVYVTEAVTDQGEDAQTDQTPVATPTIPPTPTEIMSVEEYQVQPMDTLGQIAQKFDVSVEEIMQANGLSDPNSLSVGLTLYIPTTPQAIATTAPTSAPSTPSATSAGTPESTQEPGVVINSVIGAGDLTSERVFITRTGDGELSMVGWTLQDDDGNIFEFPQLALYKDGAVNLWTKNGTPTVVDLYWELQDPVWESGDTVTLLDADGVQQASYQVP